MNAPLDDPRIAHLGRRYAVAGHDLALYRSGTGGPAVVFLPGAGMVGLDLLNLHEQVATATTSVVYDRGGTGWSDVMALPRSATVVTDELRALLRVAGVPAPYVLVGHSLGGAYARHYAQRFPSEVAALLLMDPAHEEIPAHMPAAIRMATEQMKGFTWEEAPPGLLELFSAILPPKFARWPAEIRDALMAYHLDRWRVGMVEASNAEDVVYPELQAAGPTPDVPTVVLGAMGTDSDTAALTPVEVQHAVNEGKRIVNRRLARSVPRGEYRELADASHAWMHFERPDAIVLAITDLLARVRA